MQCTCADCVSVSVRIHCDHTACPSVGVRFALDQIKLSRPPAPCGLYRKTAYYQGCQPVDGEMTCQVITKANQGLLDMGAVV